MNAETFNARYPVGTPVFAYPGARPEDIPSARRLVTRTRTEAQSVGLDRDGVVWVEGHGAYISLTHVDPVPLDEWETARTAEAVRELGALPMPVSPASSEFAKLRTRIAELEAARQADHKAWRYDIRTARTEREASAARIAELEKRLHDAAMTRTWRNEDGKKFVFVDDIAPALLGLEPKAGEQR